jgi:peptidoglycan DL-endopeptidase CwlO
VGTRPFVSTTLRRSTSAIAAGALAVGVLISLGGPAVAAPQPTVAQVQAKLSQLNTRSAVLDQRYNQVQLELTAANQRLRLVDREATRYLARFQSMRAEIARIATIAYENGNMTSVAALLTSGDAQQVLDQSSILLELSSDNNAEMSQFISAAHQLTGAQQAAQRAKTAIVALRNNLVSQRKSLAKQSAQQKALLAQLTPAQQQAVGPGGGGPGSGGGPGKGTPPAYKGPTSTQAGRAVAFAYAQLGKPYVFGASGPDSYDCSGLTMASWAAAGVSIPRVSYAQMSGLPSVPLSNLQPGDILGFAGNSHVGLYVGGGYLIDAPVPGKTVEKVALSGWYQSNLDGAVRP